MPVRFLVESPQPKTEGHMNFHFVAHWKQGQKEYKQGEIWLTNQNKLVIVLFLRQVNQNGSLNHRKYNSKNDLFSL